MMDAHTARLMIAGGAVVFVGGCVALSRLVIPPGKGRVREPEPPAAYEFRGMNDDGTARVYHPEIGTFYCAVGGGPVVRDGSRFNDRGEFVLSDGEKARVAEAAATRAQLTGGVDGLTDPLAHKPEWPPSVLVDSAGEPWRPSGGSAVLNRDQVAATFAKDPDHAERTIGKNPALAAPFGGDPAAMSVSASPMIREEGAQLVERAREIRQAAHVSDAVTPNEYMTIVKLTDKDLLATGYDPRHGRQWYVKPVRYYGDGKSSLRWALYGPNRFAGVYTRKTSAIRGAYRRNAKIGKD